MHRLRVIVDVRPPAMMVGLVPATEVVGVQDRAVVVLVGMPARLVPPLRIAAVDVHVRDVVVVMRVLHGLVRVRGFAAGALDLLCGLLHDGRHRVTSRNGNANPERPADRRDPFMTMYLYGGAGL